MTSQSCVCDLLRRSLKNSRVHHAYLFMGDESETEKVALAFAKALNCEKNDGDFCDSCDSCLSVNGEKHPDIHILRAESKSRKISIDQVRKLEQSIFLKASYARTKVAMIHTADRLGAEAQDAFLKTLEEPPPQTVFLLLTDEPRQLKETVLSRCLPIRFGMAQRKEKTAHEQQLEVWLEEFTNKKSPEKSIFQSYRMTGKLLGTFKQIRDQKLEEMEKTLEDVAYDGLEPSQRKKWEEQLEAQAQAEYLHERSRLLKTMLEWYHSKQIHPRSVEILETLSRRLALNVNESLAVEIAMLEFEK